MSLDHRQLRLVALAALLLPALAACQQPETGVVKPARLVGALTVAPREYAQTATLTGEVQALSRADLAFRLTGQITEINVKVGDHVTASQRLSSPWRGTPLKPDCHTPLRSSTPTATGRALPSSKICGDWRRPIPIFA